MNGWKGKEEKTAGEQGADKSRESITMKAGRDWTKNEDKGQRKVRRQSKDRGERGRQLLGKERMEGKDGKQEKNEWKDLSGTMWNRSGGCTTR